MRTEAVDLYIGGGEIRQHVAVSVLDADSLLDIYAAGVYGESLLNQSESVVDQHRLASRAAAATAAEAERLRAEVAEEREALEVELQRREQLRAEQQDQLAHQQALLLDLQVRRIALEAEVAAGTVESDGIGREPQASQAAQTLAPPAPGSIRFPVPTNHEIGSPYGMRMHPVLGYARLHRGADFGCQAGEPVVAAADGVVSIAGTRGGYGNAVVIDHGDKFATLYGHNSRLDVAVGDQVVAGQTIAACGSTGLSTGPHSHFETRIDGSPIDPVSLLAAD